MYLTEPLYEEECSTIRIYKNYTSGPVSQSFFWRNGYFYIANNSFINYMHDNFSSEVSLSSFDLSNNEEVLSRINNESSFQEYIFTNKSHKILKKALLLRVFVNLYNSNIRIKDFKNISVYYRNFVELNSIDFTSLLQYNNIFTDNANGNKEIGISKYVNIKEILGDRNTQNCIDTFLDDMLNRNTFSESTLNIIYEAIDAAINNIKYNN